MNNLPQINAEQFNQITQENKETCIVVFSKYAQEKSRFIGYTQSYPHYPQIYQCSYAQKYLKKKH